ncbi:hypothetical protein AVEN_206063-1 [Araneus ventricosus]|uniref:Uncharacterized protein n=1 Tax=Araneus ventricosus TaxID=182803 RepID=A0A4Y2TA30_ARAVE|nr:hypothetical protein AVEN_98120-1 [Araneus ventricosus]GBN97846.1 hypothetical protein AVEN_206063-1 [Araneus ventricosus]
MEGKAEARKHAFAAYDCKIQIRKKPVVPIFKATEREEITRFCGSWSRFALRKKTVCGAQRGRIRTPYLRRRGHGQEWVRAVEESTTQRQHSQGNRPNASGRPTQNLKTRDTLCRNTRVPVVIILCTSPTLAGPLPPRPL